jgi:hypothetical protein
VGGETASFINVGSREVVERWIGSSKDKWKNVESLQGTRSRRKTEPFGSKLLRVGKSSFERCNKFVRQRSRTRPHSAYPRQSQRAQLGMQHVRLRASNGHSKKALEHQILPPFRTSDCTFRVSAKLKPCAAAKSDSRL